MTNIDVRLILTPRELEALMNAVNHGVRDYPSKELESVRSQLKVIWRDPVRPDMPTVTIMRQTAAGISHLIKQLDTHGWPSAKGYTAILDAKVTESREVWRK